MTDCRSAISVIIPAYNASRYIVSTIESVVMQTMKPQEIIVVDDGSTDNTCELVEKYEVGGLRLVRQKHLGVSAARNNGVELSSGSCIAFLDADDLWEKDKLESQYSVFRTNPEVDAVFGMLKHFMSPEMPDTEKSRYKCPMKEMPGYVAGAMLVKRKAFYHVGLFSEQLKTGEFIEWYVRAKKAHVVCHFLKNTVIHRRIHGRNSVLSDPAKLYEDYFRVIRMNLQH